MKPDTLALSNTPCRGVGNNSHDVGLVSSVLSEVLRNGIGMSLGYTLQRTLVVLWLRFLCRLSFGNNLSLII